MRDACLKPLRAALLSRLGVLILLAGPVCWRHVGSVPRCTRVVSTDDCTYGPIGSSLRFEILLQIKLYELAFGE